METTNLVNEVGQVAITILANALALVLITLLWRASAWFTKKTKVEIPDEVEVLAEKAARKSIAYAESWARKKTAELSEKVPSNDTMRTAADFFRSWAKPKVLAWVGPKVEDYIESIFGEMVIAGEAPPPKTVAGGKLVELKISTDDDEPTPDWAK